jgi:hypothetical protein
MLSPRTSSSRPRLFVLLGLLAAAGAARAAIMDLTEEGAEADVYGARFIQFDSQTAAGTGYLDSFVRLQAKGIEAGYNTDGQLQFDTKGGPFTRAIRVGDIPETLLHGILYRQLLLDINESHSRPLLSLDELRIHVAAAANLTGYGTNPSFGRAVFDLDKTADNWIKLNYTLNSGSGRGDMLALIPSAAFGSDQNRYVYLYSRFGANHAADGGFEEWAPVRAFPIPEPASVTLLLLGAAALLPRRRRA